MQLLHIKKTAAAIAASLLIAFGAAGAVSSDPIDAESVSSSDYDENQDPTSGGGSGGSDSDDTVDMSPPPLSPCSDGSAPSFSDGCAVARAS